MLLYAPMVFQRAGFEAASDALYQSAIMFGWNLFCCVIAFWLVERLGRRPLLIGVTRPGDRIPPELELLTVPAGQ